MSAPLCNTFLLLSSTLNITEEAMGTKKQGIVSILRSDFDIPAKATSLRRTLSADMSSQKWLTQQGLVSALKKSPSSKEFDVSLSLEEGEDDVEAPSQFDIWASIQQKKKEVENGGQLDMWSSIVSQKAEEETLKCSPPYIHPLVKRSGSCLSEKSLEICTESLGSETGFDGFSLETGDMEEDKQEDQQLLYQKHERVAPAIMPCSDGEKARIAKFDYDVGKKLPNTSFPPSIPSLSTKDGASRRLKTRRDNGRLVIEAVSVPSLNNFLAQRHDGRLVLTFANTTAINDAEEEELKSYGEKESEVDIDEEEEEESEDQCCEIDQAPKLSSGVINVHRLAVMMNKPIWLANRNSTWPKLKFGDEREERVEPTTPPPPLAHSLPPRPPSKAVAAAGVRSFNAYEYHWRRPNQGMSPTMEDNSKKQMILSGNLMGNKEGKVKGEYFVPMLKGCKEARRSIFFWEPHCIATS
ncbi:enhancer of aba co-receptor 1 [Hibiscus trionum]|uniref:Enhancer of aba co-receptor 1 n=1 Tax=Hibiscus trionum TaxID=183268 RepID=A0A9W7JFE4_HIBTR|nr:enhancer of aba co-receptor 1 [Hibiscus trionum]